MASAIDLREDFDGFELRGLAKATKDAAQSRRLIALAEIYDGGRRLGCRKNWRCRAPNYPGLGTCASMPLGPAGSDRRQGTGQTTQIE